MGSMGKKRARAGSGADHFVLISMTLIAVGLGILLLSNHEGVKEIAAEVDRVERDLVRTAEEMHRLSGLEKDRAFSQVEQERLARERLGWTAPGEFILRVTPE